MTLSAFYQIMNSIEPGVSKYSYETVLDIYKLFTTGDEWSPEMRVETNVRVPKSLRSAVGSNPLLPAVDRPRIDTNDIFDTVSFEDRLLDVYEMMVFDSFNPQDWLEDFPGFESVGNLIDLELNVNIRNAIFAILQDKIAEQLSKNIARGGLTAQTSGTLTVGTTYIIKSFETGDDFSNVDGTVLLGTANATGCIFTAIGTTPTTWANGSELQELETSFFDGLETLVDADSDVIDVSNSGAITTSNVLNILEDFNAAIPAEIANKPNFKVYMSYADFNIMNEANRQSQTLNTILTIGDVTRLFGKYPIVWKSSLSKDRIIGTLAGVGMDSNLVRGTYFANDITNFLMAKESLADKIYFILLRFMAGIQYRSGSHIVNYKGVAL